MNSSKSKISGKKHYKLLDFKEFPPILGQSITIYKDTIFYRAYDIKYGTIERPSFFGEYDTARKYVREGRKLSAFITKRNIKVLDIRYVSHIINQLILLRENNKMIIGYKTLALSFGLISLYKQLELYKMRYRDVLEDDERYKRIFQYYNQYEQSQEKYIWQNPLELQGIRIGETTNDIESTIILKEIFGNYFDGIIFPKTYSPYFEENSIENELLLFEPSKCMFENKKNIVILNTDYASYINILDVIKANNINIFQVPYLMKNNKYIYYQYGGFSTNRNNPNYILAKNNLINIYYDTKEKEVKELKKIGKMFQKELFDTSTSKKINYMNEKNDLLASRQNMEFDPSGWE